jgi:hypothetical protein
MDDKGSEITRTVRAILCLALLAAVTGCHGAEKGGQAGPRGRQTAPNGEMTATVKYVDLESGFYGLVTDAGQKLDPVNLPNSFKEDELRIRVRVEKVEGRVSTHMWGPLVRIVEIERL